MHWYPSGFKGDAASTGVTRGTRVFGDTKAIGATAGTRITWDTVRYLLVLAVGGWVEPGRSAHQLLFWCQRRTCQGETGGVEMIHRTKRGRE